MAYKPVIGWICKCDSCQHDLFWWAKWVAVEAAGLIALTLFLVRMGWVK
jgi:hypothetical protein